ncbi:MAG: S-layer homology domain-containing protein [Clostridia bacterium]|nr:S-layer homology domain-containing protein [Clostridia bacterium]
MKIKSLLSGVLAVVMLLTFTVAGAAVFPDIEERHSWAEEAIDDMVSRSILKGFPDGNFKPDNGITKLDSLIIAARIAGVDLPENKDFAEAAKNEYKAALELYDINYKNEVAYLLYKGILNENELSGYIGDGVKANALKRHEAAILLTKLMGGTEEATEVAGYSVDYVDLNDIPKASLPYVNYVNEKGVMKGMEDNKFMPYYEVTRAMMATMMYRAEKTLDYEVFDMYVTSVSPSAKTVKGEDDTIVVSDNTRILVDGKVADLNNLVPGITLKVTVKGDEVIYVEGLASTVQYTTTGTVSGIASSAGKKVLTLSPAGKTDGTLENYPLAETCVFKKDGEKVSYTDIKSGMYAKLEVKAGQVTSVLVETKQTTYNGTLLNVELDGKAAIKVELKDGDEETFAIGTDTKITRNGQTAEIRSLSAGDNLTVTVKAGVAVTVTATSKNSSTEGTIAAIYISADPKVVLTVGGVEKEYKVGSETKFVVDGKDATIYDLRLGATAKVSLASSTIKTITTESLVVSPVLVGTINYIHPESYVMGIDVVDAATGKVSTVQAVVKSNVTITDTTASNVRTFKALTTGRSVVAVGTVNYGVYEITSITITQ